MSITETLKEGERYPGDPMALPINQEWYKFITELMELMDHTLGYHPRIERLTLKEEWRLDAGYNPFDPDQDGDMWKNSYEAVDVDNVTLLEIYQGYARKCGLDQGVMDLKYPRIAALFKAITRPTPPGV
jgi:hypothetical protein